MSLRERIKSMRDSGKTKNFLVFLIFVCIAAVFWLILSLDDEVQTGFDISLKIENVPDSVTFVSTVPDMIHVVARDRGSVLLQKSVSGDRQLKLNFKDFAEANRFNVSRPALHTALRRLFGSSTVISSVSPDSISLLFTRYPGKKVPVELSFDASAVPGMVVMPSPELSTKTVLLYSVNRIDTVHRVFTEKIVLRNLDKSTTVDIPLVVPQGMKAIPSSVKANFVVEQLVRKESEIPVTVDNLPLGRDILFFPSRVRVAYYVPISRYNEANSGIKAVASYDEAVRSTTDKVAVKITGTSSYMRNVELLTDSVEYSLVSGK